MPPPRPSGSVAVPIELLDGGGRRQFNAISDEPRRDAGYDRLAQSTQRPSPSTRGRKPGVDVFDVSASDLAKSSSLVINASSTATVIINVIGTTDSIQNAGFSLFGGIGDADHVLYNFSGATSLTLSGVGVEGTILAPTATVTFNNGAINGSLIAFSVTGNGETHIFDGGHGASALFDGNLPGGGDILPATAVPEPASYALMAIGGVALVGFARHQRRAIRRRLGWKRRARPSGQSIRRVVVL